MVSKESVDVARRAKLIYEEKLRSDLESTNMHDFVAIEPNSGDFYIAKTLSDAIKASRNDHPNRLAFAMRVGHATAIEIGVMTS